MSAAESNPKKRDMAPANLRITEFDEADNLTATYVASHATGDSKHGRIDIIPPQDSKSTWQKFLDVFLPVGYPHSVTNDYLEYQIYDSLQAFSSSIAGLLSSRAVLSSVGVGDSTASPTAALLLKVIEESLGRIATILFAHRLGTALEPECKMYRLLADILNDTAFVLDCLSPIFPSRPMRVLVLSFSSVLRALCGVAAGSAKASLSAHFARWGNLGELNAKDSSQETVISLLGLLVGSVVVSWIVTPMATWSALILLLAVHLETNRRAVRAVCMRTLNRQRATLVFHQLQKGRVPMPEDIAQEERIFERDGVLRRQDGGVAGTCAIGVPLSRLLASIATTPASSKRSVRLEDQMLQSILTASSSRSFILGRDRSLRESDGNSLFVVLKRGASNRDVLVAWWSALISACDQGTGKDASNDRNESNHEAVRLMQRYAKALEEKGWDLSASALETTTTTRIVFED